MDIDRLVIAIVQDEDADLLLAGLREAGIGATKIGSSGGFLRTGNSTIMIGVPNQRVETAMRQLGVGLPQE